MIDVEKIRQRPTAWRIFTELISNVLQLALIFYGLKCIITLHGKMPVSVMGAVYSSTHWTSVTGITAVTIGLCYLGFGLFIYLSDGRPPEESRKWFWRIGRALLRWGSLTLAMFCFFEADKTVAGYSLNLAGFPPYLLIKIIVFIAGFMVLLSFLSAMFQREQVKRDLYARGCKPIRIWWRPAAYWLWRFWFSYWGATGFRVIYSDSFSVIHKCHCFVYRSFWKDWQWGNRRVRWLTDTVTGQLPSPEVWASDEIIRPKLEKWNESTEADNLLENPDEPPE